MATRAGAPSVEGLKRAKEFSHSLKKEDASDRKRV